MSSRFTRLVGQTGLYALATGAVKLSGLILTPILLNTTFLSQAGYGQLEILLVTAQLGMMVTGLGIGWGMLKFLTDPSLESEHGALPFTSLVLMGLSALLVLVVFVGGAPAIARLLFGDGGLEREIRLLGAYIFVKAIGQIPYMVLRAREHVGTFVSIVLVEAVVLIGLVYYFLVGRGLGLEGVLYAYLIAASAGLALLIVLVLSRVEIRLRPRLVKRILLFGAPLVAANLADHVLKVGDRYILNWLVDAETVALYGWGGRLSNTLNLILVQSLQMAFIVLGLKSLGEGDISLHRRTFRHFVIWMGWAVLGLSLLAFDLMQLLVQHLRVDPEYLKADPLVYPLSLGFLAYGTYMIVVNVLYASERTRVVGTNMFMAAILNIALNLVLIPFFGMMGAALATVLAYLFLALYTARIANREIRIGYPWHVFWVVAATTAVLVLLAQPTTAWAAGPRLAVRIAAIVAYVPLVFLFRLYSVSDAKDGLQTLRLSWRRRRS